MVDEKRKVLLHCAAGISRSATFMLAYYIAERGMSYTEALSFVKSKRKYISPNSGFRVQLWNYAKELGRPGKEEEHPLFPTEE